MNISIDFSKQKSCIKPLHGVNNGPKTQGFMRDASPLFKRAGIPYSRLHDTEGSYGAGEYVDIPAVFKCFDADPENPNSYNFMLTDKYIEAIRETGAKVIYRLGVSIENGVYKKYIYPPKDYKQWARICEGIIKHYTQGWADGYENAVEYFEIWNEPEFTNHMWIGTDEEFYKLFKDTIIYLKEKFPNVKIGGPGSGYSRPEFIEGFFKYLTEGQRAPLDFFSWHSYFTDIDDVKNRCESSYDFLKRYGYEDSELICTEWNLVEDWFHMGIAYEKISDERGGAFAACALCNMQKSELNIANYYQVNINSPFNGLYKIEALKHHDDPLGTVPKPAFFAFECFNELYKLGTEVHAECSENDICTLAATDGKEKAILISRFDNSTKAEKILKFNVENFTGNDVRIYKYSKDDNEMVMISQGEKPDTITMSPYDVTLVRLKQI